MRSVCCKLYREIQCSKRSASPPASDRGVCAAGREFKALYVMAACAMRMSIDCTAGQGDQGSPGRVSRADVAAVAIAALDQADASNRRTVELSSRQSDAVKLDQLQHVFDGTKADA